MANKRKTTARGDRYLRGTNMPKRANRRVRPLSPEVMARFMVHAFTAHIHVLGLDNRPLPQVVVGWAVAAYPGVTHTELMEMSGMTSRVISGAVKAQIKNGRIRQVIDQHDRRVRRLYMTDEMAADWKLIREYLVRVREGMYRVNEAMALEEGEGVAPADD